MIIVRPARREDALQVYDLSEEALTGLTTLPHDKGVIEDKIEESVATFENLPNKPGGETFLFVMEDLNHRKIIGTSAIISKVGGFKPFYTYKIKSTYKKSDLLNVKKKVEYLQLKTNHDGPSEVGTLFLLPEYRKNGNGRLLSLSRFLFMAEYSDCFESTVLAELRGTFEKDGTSLFWESLGRHFFEVEFERADLMVMKDKTFIAELMPRHPIYIPLLTKDAQKIIGKEDSQTTPARHLLESEGFEYHKEIDIFEAGPVLSAKVDQIRTVQKSVQATIKDITDKVLSDELYFIANINNLTDYSVALGHIDHINDHEVIISQKVAKALKLKNGNRVRIAPIKG